MQVWADINRALNLKLRGRLERAWDISTFSPRKAMQPTLCLVVRRAIIWHYPLSSEICWNKTNVELSLRRKNKVHHLKS